MNGQQKRRIAAAAGIKKLVFLIKNYAVKIIRWLIAHTLFLHHMEKLKLYMLLLGCKPAGRHTEQHDIFFSIGRSVKDLVPQIIDFWPEANGKIHIDGWREVTFVDSLQVRISPATEMNTNLQSKLFFINLGGYKKNEFDEFHYRMLVAGSGKEEAVKKAKQTAFYKHTGFHGASSHIDDKYGIDVDDIYAIEEILPAKIKAGYTIQLSPKQQQEEDKLHLGYFKLDKL
jgi:hypothetical protein